MSATSKLDKYLPLSETTFYIMLALTKPLHGYGVMQEVERITGGLVSIGPGTLYGAFSTLEQQKLIRLVEEVDRRRIYQLSEQGREVLRMQMERLELMRSVSNQYTESREKE